MNPLQYGLEGLSPKEQKVLQYINEFTKEIENLSIQQLAEEVGVSPATISRLSRKLGYSTFNKFKLELAKTHYDDVLDARIDSTDDGSLLTAKLAVTMNVSVQQTIGMLDFELLEKSSQKLKEAKTIYLFGVGASGIVCSDFYYKLNRIGKSCVYVQDAHIQLASVASIQPGDLAFGISYEGSTKEVIEPLKFAQASGAKTIAITGIGKTNLDKYADYLFKIPRHEHELRVGAITSRNNSLLITDLLYLNLIQGETDKISTILANSKSLARKLKN
ncbi:MurR/RpiR family transcriptional regulator [Streptococcus ovis]|uniref:MurR/RpiR family transcriptional regulator n=1 Tax=Streptococcus ovis TaxID=82806 RepID=UPI0003813248|nr:MurR/RpiR family transcriptional regulator [Streptococcus ovis]